MNFRTPQRWLSSLGYLTAAATLSLLVGCGRSAKTVEREAGNTSVYTVDEMKSNDHIDKIRDSAS